MTAGNSDFNDENPYRGPESDSIESADILNGKMEAIRKQFLLQESSVKGIGFLMVYLGIRSLIYGFILAVPEALPVLGLERDRFGRNELLPEVAVANGKFVMFYGVFHIWIGWGLINLRNWGRITMGILALPGLIGFPICTLIYGYILYSLYSKKGKYVFSREYKQVMASTQTIRRSILTNFIAIFVFLILYYIPWIIIAIF